MRDGLKIRLAALIFLFSNVLVAGFKDSLNAQLKFRENKGQVYDQYNMPRADILFSGCNHDLVYHLKTNGISYQLSAQDVVKDLLAVKNKTELPETAIYRVDANWINSNTAASIKASGVTSDHENFILSSCASGISEVNSFTDVTYFNLYNGIDLHYYSKNGKLKYDYLVAAGVDHKKIMIEIKGAASISINELGELVIKTPLGNLVEEAPEVFQSKKRLSSKWKLSGNIVSFDIEGIDPFLPFVIDPAVRVWGSYYADATPNDKIVKSTFDNVGNICYSGYTSSSNNALIATTGAYQTTLAGSYDAFIAKFDPAGNRIWATYYGGNGMDAGLGIAGDKNGNIYLAGYTTSTLNNVMASAGAHQSTLSGTFDGFLSKFNSSGMRIWGTYYGGNGYEQAHRCCLDTLGNVYLSGFTSTNAGTAIATASGHQPLHGGNQYDCYLAKFNANGVRLWGTYYGGNGNEQSNAFCTTDKWNNVYLSASTNSNDASIATSGAHQTNLAGFINSFIVKFSPSGLRKWSTYYGGANYEYANACKTDANGNVYLLGSASSTAVSVISTAGSHQQNYGGGNSDGYLVKFDSLGTRQWGTYYGGINEDYFEDCDFDASGNVFVVGWCSAASANVISTANAYQLNYNGGNSDGMIVKLNANGVRLWGTYYGGNYNDILYTVVTDGTGNIYVAGSSTSTTSALASPGCFQSAYGGGYLAKFYDCPTSGSLNITVSSGPTICQGQTSTLTASSGPLTYTWSTGSNNSFVTVSPNSNTTYTVGGTDVNGCKQSAAITLTVQSLPLVSIVSSTFNPVCPGFTTSLFANGPVSTYTWSNGSNTSSISVTPSVNTIYSVSATGTNNCINTATYAVSMAPVPVILVSGSTSYCEGDSTTITASGANSYTWITGENTPSINVNSMTSLTYTVGGQNAWGCVGTNTVNIIVKPKPVITISGNTYICDGTSTTLTANGAATYTWSTGLVNQSIILTPSLSTAYTVTGTGANGCIGIKPFTIFLSSPPTVSITSSDSIICAGESVTLTAVGNGSVYIWNTLDTGNVLVVTPTVSTTYSVFSANSGCLGTYTITQNVSLCNGLEENYEEKFKLWPNPNNGQFYISKFENNIGKDVLVYNSIGQLIQQVKIENAIQHINISAFANGFYFVIIKNGNTVLNISKVIKD